jgi:hypothetical protein
MSALTVSERAAAILDREEHQNLEAVRELQKLCRANALALALTGTPLPLELRPKP